MMYWSLPNRSMRIIRTALLLVLFTHCGAACAQRFVVDLCPDDSPITEAELNIRLRGAGSVKEVEQVFRNTFSQAILGKVSYHELLDDGRAQDLTYYIPSGSSARTALRTLGTRDVYTGPLSGTAELEALFADSLSVVGTLELPLGASFPSDEAEGYFLFWASPGSDEFRSVDLPLEEGSLRIQKDLFRGMAGDRVEVILRNHSRGNSVLGHAFISFIPSPVERNLRTFICEATAGGRGLTLAQRRAECVRLSTELYGHMYPPNALRLMCMD